MPRTKTITSKCKCEGCAGLLAECGPVLFPLYSKKLLVPGWAGQATLAEKRYRSAHRENRSGAQPEAIPA